jgi:hypothetical protein
MAKRKAYPLRLSEDILEAVSRWAEEDLRSVNGQIEYLLRDALWRAGRLKPPEKPTRNNEPLPEE